MTLEAIASRIEELEAEIAMLKAELKRATPPAAVKTLGDLCGIWKEHGEFTKEEIDAVLYRLPDDEMMERHE